MLDPLITLTTDFGEASPYVAAMKGVILSINPRARLLDLSHQIPPQDVGYTAFFLAAAIPTFPPGVIHVIVVDPGVGTERALLHVEIQGQRLLVPDNGCWTELIRNAPTPPRVLRLSQPRYWRQPVSATFHGRDILAPVAGYLSLGVAPSEIGIPATDWVRWQAPCPRENAQGLAGEVLFVDTFGNLITNLPGTAFSGGAISLHIGTQEINRRVNSYAEAEPGTLVALVSSQGMVEIAVNHGNAARRLNAGVGTPVALRYQAPSAPHLDPGRAQV
jgi:S-adenosylmethionine hydrolase